MMAGGDATIHASAVLIGAKAALIRGPSGSGKSRLAFDILQAAATGTLPFARLVGDDRVHVEAPHGRLLVRPAQPLAGKLEIRGLGIRELPYEALASVGFIVDLGGAAERMPDPASTQTTVNGVHLPRLAVAAGHDALAAVLAFLHCD